MQKTCGNKDAKKDVAIKMQKACGNKDAKKMWQ